MKHALLSLALIIFALFGGTNNAQAQYVPIPDANFRAWINTTTDSSCMVGNQLDTICAQNNHIADTLPYNSSYTLPLDLSNLNIADFTGMQYLRFNVVYQNFNTSGAWVTASRFNSINLSHNALTSFPDQIMTIFTAPSVADFTSQSLDLSYNHIDTFIHSTSRDAYTIDLSHNGMHYFSLGTSQYYDLTNINLDYNNLSSLPSFYFRNTFYLTQNCLVILSARHNNLLNCPSGYFYNLDIGANQISNLSFSSLCYSGTHLLKVDSNVITSANIISPAIGALDISHNQISNLNISTAVSGPCAIGTLICSDNNIQTLPALTTSLSYLDCHNNPNLRCLPALPYVSSLYLNIDSTIVSCLPNRYSTCTYTGSTNLATLPICDYGNSSCTPYHMISGLFYIDSNNNCTYDAGETKYSNAKVYLYKNGQYAEITYTDTNGYYGFWVSDSGTYTVSYADSMFVSYCMSNGGAPVHISADSALAIALDFGIRCKSNPIPDYGVVFIMSPVAHSFRSSLITPVQITATGTTILGGRISCASGLPGTLTISYSGTIHYAGPAPGAMVPSAVNGNTVTYTYTNLDSLTGNALGILFSTDTSAVIGSTVCITAIISSTPADNSRSDDTLKQCFVVHDPHDPNLKEVYPLDTMQAGQWLTYTVNFQNTGNDTAHKVVVRDTLSQYVDASSFRFLGASSTAIVALINNAVAVTFPEIDLVDSSTNAAASTGWMQYQVKSLSGLPNRTKVENTAFVYFDSEPPVVTDTTVNTVFLRDDTTHTFTFSICEGDSFLFFGQSIKQAGTYSDTFQRADGSDSIYVLYLSIKSIPRDTFTVNICWGENYTFDGTIYYRNGYYPKVYMAQNGCDSFSILHLVINSLPTIVWNPTDTIVALWCQCYSWLSPHNFTATPLGGTYSGAYVLNDSLTFPYPHCSEDFWDSTFKVTYTYTDTNQCISSKSYNYQMYMYCEGINDISAYNPISLYPNPNRGSFTLQTTGSINQDYTISDMLGHIITQQKIQSDSQQIDLRDADEGVYMLTVKGAMPIRFTVVR